MKTAIILTAGNGSKIWPYEKYRPKCLLPIGNRPIIHHQVIVLKELGITRIIVAANRHHEAIAAFFLHDSSVEVQPVGDTSGSAITFTKALPDGLQEPVLVLFGDCWIHRDDLRQLINTGDAGVLLTPHTGTSRDYIGCTENAGFLTSIIGHSRNRTTHHILATVLHPRYSPYMGAAKRYFPRVEVGMMAPDEQFFEAGLVNMLENGVSIRAVVTKQYAKDVDKPWHLLEANAFYARGLCSELNTNQLGEGASIDPSAKLDGFVRLGRNSRIGRNVIIEGNIWVGDNTVIDNGAFLRGWNVIGDKCEISYGCYIERNAVIGNRCKILHGAEFSGLLFSNVYLYHYMEIFGIVGENTDIGAGTVCGSLRFDDGLATHRIQGRRESVTDADLANACYIGDQCRTGVNAVLMPGVKMGTGSIVGSGVILSEDLESGKMVMVKQNLLKRDWGPERYGW